MPKCGQSDCAVRAAQSGRKTEQFLHGRLSAARGASSTANSDDVQIIYHFRNSFLKPVLSLTHQEYRWPGFPPTGRVAGGGANRPGSPLFSLIIKSIVKSIIKIIITNHPASEKCVEPKNPWTMLASDLPEFVAFTSLLALAIRDGVAELSKRKLEI
jgi:hypothetical protein